MFKNINPNYAIMYSTILWGTWWYPLRLLNEYGDNNAMPIVTSFLIATTILFIISYKKIHLFSKKNIYLTLIAAVSGGAAMCLYNEGLLRGNVGRTILFFYLTSVWSTLIEVYFLKKPLTYYRGFSITAGFTGLFIMNGIDQGNFLPNSAADFYGIAAGIIWSLGATMLRVNDELDVNVTTALCILFGAIFILLATLLPDGQTLGGFQISMISENLILIIAMALIWIIPAYWLNVMGSDQVDPGRAGVLMMTEVLIGFISAYLLANELISLREAIGAVFILSAPLVELHYSGKDN